MRASPADISLLRSSDLFDGEWYIRRYRDVSLLRMDPAEHYLWLGAKLRRNPSPRFNTGYYLQANPDIASSDHNPLVHFLRYGRDEGRRPLPPKPLDYGQYFDERYYAAQAGLDIGSRDLLLQHYEKTGWREGLNPSRFFDTRYYLDRNRDIAAAGVNPLTHFISSGKSEGRKALPYTTIVRNLDAEPLVSVIVPNYNHARFLRQRIDSILDQTYGNIELIILDDCSTDESREVIESYLTNDMVSFHPNEHNSGNVFRQWRKGIELAKGELIWICESDDFCESDFLAKIVPAFAEQSAMLAFGRIQFATQDGGFLDGLDGYREAALPSGWSEDLTRTAAEWFSDAFAISNIVPNVGGCLFRNQAISEEVWRELEDYQIVGDWRLYLELAQGGTITFVRDAVAYFRQHGNNTSVKSFLSVPYYAEHAAVMRAIRRRWNPSASAVAKFVANVEFQYNRVNAGENIGPLENHFSEDKMQPQGGRIPHVLMLILDFSLGGGEIFPIYLANELVDRGYRVSIAALRYDLEPNPIRQRLDARIPVYDLDHVVSNDGFAQFVEEASVDLVHSHCFDMDHFIFNHSEDSCPVPFIVTNHGSYECQSVSAEAMENIVRAVDHWIYLTPKNLAHLSDEVAKSKATHLINGMPGNKSDTPLQRRDFGLDAASVVFAVGSRAIPEKGWELAIKASQELVNRGITGFDLVFCGDGPELPRLQKLYGDLSWVKFLGFRDDIPDVYEMADCAMLPTRFVGESYPLTLIEALQVGRPIISSFLGHIPEIVIGGGRKVAGLLVQSQITDDEFVIALADAMARMMDPDRRAEWRQGAVVRGKEYSMETVADAHVDLYRKMAGDVDWSAQ